MNGRGRRASNWTLSDGAAVVTDAQRIHAEGEGERERNGTHKS